MQHQGKHAAQAAHGLPFGGIAEHRQPDVQAFEHHGQVLAFPQVAERAGAVYRDTLDELGGDLVAHTHRRASCLPTATARSRKT